MNPLLVILNKNYSYIYIQYSICVHECGCIVHENVPVFTCLEAKGHHIPCSFAFLLILLKQSLSLCLGLVVLPALVSLVAHQISDPTVLCYSLVHRQPCLDFFSTWNWMFRSGTCNHHSYFLSYSSRPTQCFLNSYLYLFNGLHFVLLI